MYYLNSLFQTVLNISIAAVLACKIDNCGLKNFSIIKVIAQLYVHVYGKKLKTLLNI